MSVAARVDGDHFELPSDAVELLRQVRPADQQWFIEEVTQALAVAAVPRTSDHCKTCSKPGPRPSASSSNQVMRRCSSGCSAASVASLWSLTGYVARAARAVRWVMRRYGACGMGNWRCGGRVALFEVP
jgi:hypothetical protein